MLKKKIPIKIFAKVCLNKLFRKKEYYSKDASKQVIRAPQKRKKYQIYPFMFLIGILLLFSCGHWIFPAPPLLEKYTYSKAVYDSQNQLMYLGVSLDDKYRLFVPYSKIPPDAVKALLLYEDQYFFYHFGVNPLSIVRAIKEMMAGGRRQGASTITMQTARLIYHIDSTTVPGKIWQLVKAVQLELFYTKEEILEAYFNLAPYGGNVEGIGAASLIYFNTRTSLLNKNQIAALTVIPQNPGKRSPLTSVGCQNIAEAVKRLQRIWQKEDPKSDLTSLNLPIQFQIKRPLKAPHTVMNLVQIHNGEIFTTLNIAYQTWLEKIIKNYIAENQDKGFKNAAALLVNYQTGNVIASVGSADFFSSAIQGQVDGTRAKRSPGSLLKPFIYALALEQGLIHPYTQLKDVPRNYYAYSPDNFDHLFYGMISATQALIQSRNIPAIDLLMKIKLEKFNEFLQKNEVILPREPAYYGLGLAVGGVELSMQEIARLYMMIANLGETQDLNYLQKTKSFKKRVLSKEAAWLTLSMLAQNPPPDKLIHPFQSPLTADYTVYWKTGTSYGFKDAWTAGIAGKYVLVVWLGNFDGRSNNALIGRSAAAPLFFQIIRSLAQMEKISPPFIPQKDLNLQPVSICAPTGDIANDACTQKITGLFIPGITQIKLSNISRVIPVNKKTGLRACRHKPPLTELKSFEFWPSDILKIYSLAGIQLKIPPAFETDCAMIETFYKGDPPKILYPVDNSIFIIQPQQKNPKEIFLKASLDSDARQLYWFWDNKLVGISKAEETITVPAIPGTAQIKAVDEHGRFSTVSITIKQINE